MAQGEPLVCVNCSSVPEAVTWIVLAAIAALAMAFPLRSRLPGPVVAASLASCGAAIAWGLLLLQARPTAAEKVLAVLVTALILPVHVRIVLGRFGPDKRESGPAGG